MWDYDAKALKLYVEGVTGPLVVDYDIYCRAMFGGFMFYANGRPFASISLAGIALKLSADDTLALTMEGGYALRYEPDASPSKSYTVLPKEMTETNDDIVLGWLLRSMDYVRTLPLKKKKPKKKK